MKVFLFLIFFLIPLESQFGLRAESSFESRKLCTKQKYKFSTDPIDVIIPCSPKDKRTVELCIESTRKHVQNIRRIIIISSEPITHLAEWFDENKYPFSKLDIAMELFNHDLEKAKAFIKQPKTRIGWIFQQLLKLYAYLVIPDISPNILIVDADVIWLNPIRFMNEAAEPLFITGKEYHKPYFDHLSRLLRGVKRVHEEYSGVTHHMLFQAPILDDLFNQIRLEHKMDPWKAICRCIDPLEISSSPFSEYEIYFNFALSRTDQCHLNFFKWKDCKSLSKLNKYRKKGYAYVAYHCR